MTNRKWFSYRADETTFERLSEFTESRVLDAKSNGAWIIATSCDDRTNGRNVEPVEDDEDDVFQCSG